MITPYIGLSPATAKRRPAVYTVGALCDTRPGAQPEARLEGGGAYETGGESSTHHRGGERYGPERGGDLRAGRRTGHGCRRARVRGAPGGREDRRGRRPGAVRETRRHERSGLAGGGQGGRDGPREGRASGGSRGGR